MFDPEQYQLLDFGAGRKLERFGQEILDRPSPAAEGAAVADPAAWRYATARFDLVSGGTGEWDDAALSLPDGEQESWSVRHADSRLVMQLNTAGNVGLFPEQASNWDWIAEQVELSRQDVTTRAPRVLNLFAYTGGASLAAAAAGAEVTHVDASGPTVSAAKRNAEVSGLADAPIRWLIDDAIKFVARECRRAKRYDGVILDPPTYGKGPKGKPFKFAQHLTELMEHCGELLEDDADRNRFLLFSCHAPGFGIDDARVTVESVLPRGSSEGVVSRPLSLESTDGRTLKAGVSAHWSSTAS